MKKTILVSALAMVMVFAFAASAFAAAGPTAYSGGNPYLTGTGSPHGGYITSSTKCAVCHAVHWANSGGEALLQSSRADACTYCHISGATPTVLTVYGGVPANYTLASDRGHNADEGATCTGCHQVHGATDVMTGVTYLDSKILSTQYLVPAEGAGNARPAYDLSATYTGATDEENIARWCSGCHNYFATAKDGTSHVMMAASGVKAFVDSTTCQACHSYTTLTGEPVGAGSAFPHFTDNPRFLNATDSRADGVCLDCHVNGAADSGVGIDF